MVSYQNLRGEHLRQNRQKGRQEIEGDNESEAEVGKCYTEAFHSPSILNEKMLIRSRY
jgi:hypothetical protein